MRARRLIGTGLVALVCAAVAGTALAAPASGGRHLPYFSLMDERVAVTKLPFAMRLLFGHALGIKGSGPPRHGHGPLWFGEVERPNATIFAAARGHWVCDFERSHGDADGGGGSCTTTAGARELGLLDVGSCGKGRPRHFRINGLVPDGVTGLELERSDGTIGRTVPVIDNTFAFTVGREDFKLHGVGDVAAEKLERTLPLGHVGGPDSHIAGCTLYSFFEAKGGA
jgi:hypothetical protein